MIREVFLWSPWDTQGSLGTHGAFWPSSSHGLLAETVAWLLLERDIKVDVTSFCPPGTQDMWRAYRDMRDANYIGADKYFHARGNYDAARRGPGGAWAAKTIR